MDSLFRDLQIIDESIYINAARIRLRPEDYDKTEEVVKIGEIDLDKGIL